MLNRKKEEEGGTYVLGQEIEETEPPDVSTDHTCQAQIHELEAGADEACPDKETTRRADIVVVNPGDDCREESEVARCGYRIHLCLGEEQILFESLRVEAESVAGARRGRDQARSAQRHPAGEEVPRQNFSLCLY